MKIIYPIADAHTFSHQEIIEAFKMDAEAGLSQSCIHQAKMTKYNSRVLFMLDQLQKQLK